jgi:hypothetical protein
MSALRPAMIVATLVKRLSRSHRLVADPDGPGCSCESCEHAWRLHHPPVRAQATEVAFSRRRRWTV